MHSKRKDVIRALEKTGKQLKQQTQSLANTRRALKASHERYTELYDEAPVGFLTLTAFGLIEEINRPAVRLLNHKRLRSLGLPFKKFIDRSDHKKFLEYLSRCRKYSDSTHPLSIELQLARRAGRPSKYAELVSLPSPDREGGPAVYKCVLRDITHLKQMQEAQRWLAAIVESSDDAIIGLDPHGKIISSNKGAWLLYGYKPEELAGRSISILIPPDIKNELRKIFDHIRRGERIVHYETVRRHKDGRRIDVSLTISPIRNSHGEIIGASKISHDITERKRGEKQLEESLAREKSTRVAAEAASRAKDEFLAALSHELRTPLNPVLLLASEAARNPELPPGVRTDFNTIRKNIEFEARLIDDLLDVTRITHHKLTLNQSELDVHTILNDAIATVLNEIEEKRLVLRLNFHAARSKIFGDAVRIQQIFWNVLKNAVKFSYEGGRLTIETRTAPHNKIAIIITDTGIGMSPEEIKHVFAAFSQGTHVFGGLGLGLAISRALVELHTGSIRATSRGKGRGASFTIELPLVKGRNGEKVPRTNGKPSLPVFKTGKVTKDRLHILLVEDHEATRSALMQLLLRRRYHVTGAASVAEARLQMAHHRFQLLISDIGLPDGTGYDLMREFLVKFGTQGIALTGYGMEQDIEKSQAAGFATHLTKPIRIESLDNALASIAKK